MLYDLVMHSTSTPYLQKAARAAHIVRGYHIAQHDIPAVHAPEIPHIGHVRACLCNLVAELATADYGARHPDCNNSNF